MNKTYFGDVESRVEFARGYCEAVNSVAKTGMPYLDPDKCEKAIRNQVNRFYGNSKYDGKGNLK